MIRSSISRSGRASLALTLALALWAVRSAHVDVERAAAQEPARETPAPDAPTEPDFDAASAPVTEGDAGAIEVVTEGAVDGGASEGDLAARPNEAGPDPDAAMLEVAPTPAEEAARAPEPTPGPAVIPLSPVPSPGASAIPAAAPLATKAAWPAPDQVVPVTGSRIARRDVHAAGHAVVLTQRELQLTGATTLNEALIRLPTVTLSGLQKNNNEGGNGLAFVELRNLGAHRTLVLVNGRRMVSTSTRRTEAVDLNNIPLSLIERVEVLLDGASAIYGSDAVGGVVNIILRQDFDGVRASAFGGVSDKGDADEVTGEVTMGKNHDRGNLTVSIEGQVRRPVWQGDRAWSRQPITEEPKFVNGVDDSQGIARTYGSALVPEGSVRLPGGTRNVFFRPDPASGASFTPLTSTGLDQRYNFAPSQYLVGAQERLTIAALADYDLSDAVRAFVEASHTYRHSQTRLAPQPFSATDTFRDGFVVPVSNPFVPQDLRETLDPAATTIALARRNSELGDRVRDIDAHTSRVVLGLAGEVPRYQLDWELYANYGVSRTQQETRNSLNLARARETADPAVCERNAQRGCVVGDYFGAGALQPEVVDYIRYRDRETTGYSHFSAGASLSARPFTLWRERVGIAAGALVRREAGYDTPDAITIAGDSSTPGGNERTAGSYRSAESFLELSVPLLAHLPAIEELRMDLAGRYAHHDTFGSQLTYRGAVSYLPIAGLRLRASYATAFRAPGIAQLFTGRADSFERVADPCSDWATSATIDPQVRANCMQQGVPGEYRQTTTTGPSVRANVGGNAKLKAETAKVLNLGLAFAPSFLPRAAGTLGLSVDYYRVRLEDAIVASPQETLDSCYRSPGLSADTCAGITRGADGGIVLLDGRYRNLELVATSGIDFGAAYALPVSAFGIRAPVRVHVEWQGNRLLYKDDYTAAGKIRGAGTISSGGGAQPFWRWNILAGVSGERWSFLSTHRYIGSAKVYRGSAADPVPYDSVSPIAYWDVVARYEFEPFALLTGVTNLLDREPPFFFDARTNSNPNTYDYVGRFFFARMSVQR